MKLPVALGAGQFKVAARLRIQHQRITAESQLGPLQRRCMQRVAFQRAGVLQVGHQSARCPQGQGVLLEAKAIKGAEPVVVQQRLFSFRAAEGGVGHRGELEPVRAPGRSVAGRSTPHQFGGLQPR